MSWHIYPDFNVFSPNRFVSFKDKLVNPGGVVTLGLEPNREGCSGVNWSVSLSHLRYYGDPVVVKKSSEEDSDRVTANELQFISFGCVLSSWANPGRVKIIEAAECFAALGEALKIEGNIFYSDGLGWIAPLIETAKQFLLTADKDREAALYFVEFGRRRGRKFLDPNFSGVIPLFGLVSPLLLFKLSIEFTANGENTEASIASLRQLAHDCNFDRHDCVIVSRPRWRFTRMHTTIEDSYEGNWEMASAIPTPRFTSKRSQTGELIVTERHTRWVHIDRTRDPMMQRYIDLASDTEHSELFDVSESPELPQLDYPTEHSNFGFGLGEIETEQDGSIHSMKNCECFQNRLPCNARCLCRAQAFRCTSNCSCIGESTGLESIPRCSNMRQCRSSSNAVDEECFWLSVRSTFDMDYNTQLLPSESTFNWQDPPSAYFERYSKLRNDPLANASECTKNHDIEELMASVENEGMLDQSSSYDTNSVGFHIKFRSLQANGTAGLFLTDMATVNTENFSLTKMTKILQSSTSDVAKLRAYLIDVPYRGIVDHSGSLDGEYHYSIHFFKSLKAMSAVSELYSDWPEATISISITKNALGCAEWASYVWNHDDFHGNTKAWRSAKFACLATLESGGYDIHPRQAELVMAMATGNSIYAFEALLQDPVLPDNSGLPAFKGIRRIFGNIGYPGVVMLIPPPTPRKSRLYQMRKRLTQDLIFDGRPEHAFTETSLHLKFTEFNFPLASGPGAVDAEMVMREALISVYAESRWITDLDILEVFENLDLIRLPGCKCVRREEEIDLCQLLVQSFDDQLKVITVWDELLLCRENLIQGEIGTVLM